MLSHFPEIYPDSHTQHKCTQAAHGHETQSSGVPTTEMFQETPRCGLDLISQNLAGGAGSKEGKILGLPPHSGSPPSLIISSPRVAVASLKPSQGPPVRPGRQISSWEEIWFWRLCHLRWYRWGEVGEIFSNPSLIHRTNTYWTTSMCRRFWAQNLQHKRNKTKSLPSWIQNSGVRQ